MARLPLNLNFRSIMSTSEHKQRVFDSCKIWLKKIGAHDSSVWMKESAASCCTLPIPFDACALHCDACLSKMCYEGSSVITYEDKDPCIAWLCEGDKMML
eukprot:4047624-Karenia_brevis.AAC.1